MTRICQRLSVGPVILLLTLLFSFVHTATANNEEDNNGIIKGKVLTSDGKPAPDVAVILIGTRHATSTDNNGAFTFRGVQPGNYQIAVSLTGFGNIIKDVAVSAGKTTSLQLQLEISTKELHEVVITGNRNKLVKTTSEYVAKMPLKNLENPQVYTTITKDLMMEQQAFSVADALRNTPGLTKMWDATGRGGDGAEYYNMRGFIVQPLLRNGVAGNVSSKTDITNLERLEVIKGPSATLFGNALTTYAGLINRVTKKPYGKFGGEVAYAGGSYAFNRLSADVNTPLDSAGDVLLRVNTSYTSEGSFQDNGWSRLFAFAPSLSYRVNDRLSFNFDAEYFQGQNTGLGVFFFPFDLTVANLGVNRADQLSIGYKRSYANDDLYQTSKNLNFFAQMNYKLSDQWTSQTNVTITNSFSDGPSPYFYLLPGNKTISRNDQFTEQSKDQVTEIQQNFIGDFNIGNLRNRFVGGLDFFYHNSDQFFGGGTFDTIPTTGSIPNYRDFNRTNLDKMYQEKGIAFNYPIIFKTYTYSAYISDVLNITDNLMAMAALRVDHFDNKGNYSPQDDTYSGDYSQTTLSPKFGLVYQPIKDRLAVFANYQNGFVNKDGKDSITKKAVKPEQANQLEAGVKVDLYDGKLSATFSYYNIKVKDIVRQAGNTPNLFLQDGTQLSSGFEAEVIATPVQGLNVVAGFAYNDSRYEKTVDSTLIGRRPATASSPVTANLWISYRLAQGRLKGLGFGFGGNYASDNKVINTRVYRDAEGNLLGQGVFTLPAYTILNGTVFYDTPKFRLSVKMDNITNQRYWIGYTTVNPQKLRSITGSVAFRF